jgi:quercetin dioxygenase-like cupin family protein
MHDHSAASEKACPTEMTIRRVGAAIARAPEGVATSPFWVEMLLESAREGENTAMRATLDPGVATHWHDHPRGQILYALSGVGRVQRDGGPIEEIRAGDCVWFAPNERHWHGASPTSAFAYLSIQAVREGAIVRWMEPAPSEGSL